MRERLVEWKAARVRWIDVLRDRKPLDEHRPVPPNPLELGDRIASIRMDRRTVQKARIPSRDVPLVVVRHLEVCARGVALSLAVVHGIERKDDGSIDRTRFRDRPRQQLLESLLGPLVLTDEPELPAHEAKGNTIEQ